MASQAARGQRLNALRAGLMFGALMAVVGLVLNEGSPWRAGIIGAASGAAFGLMMLPFLRRQHRVAVAALGPMAESLDRVTVRDAMKGPPASDPARRAQQLQILNFQIQQVDKSLPVNLTAMAAFLVLEVIMAITVSPWFWIAAAVFALLLVQVPTSAARLRRRRAALTTESAT